MDTNHKPFVLIVEDDSQVFQWMQYALCQSGFEAMVVRSLEEGLFRAVDTRPDVILSDTRLPRMGGAELIAVLKADPLTAPIPVILTGTGEPLMGAGEYTFLQHPVDRASLLSAVHNAIASRELACA